MKTRAVVGYNGIKQFFVDIFKIRTNIDENFRENFTQWAFTGSANRYDRIKIIFGKYIEKNEKDSSKFCGIRCNGCNSMGRAVRSKMPEALEPFVWLNLCKIPFFQTYFLLCPSVLAK